MSVGQSIIKPSGVTKCTDVTFTDSYEWEIEGYRMWQGLISPANICNFTTAPFQLKASVDGFLKNTWKITLSGVHSDYVWANIELIQFPAAVKSTKVYVDARMKDKNGWGSACASSISVIQDKLIVEAGNIATFHEFRGSILRGSTINMRFDFHHCVSNDLVFETSIPRSVQAKEFVGDVSLSNSRESIVKKMFQNMKLSDLQVQTTDGQAYPVHKAVLASQSPVFENMFLTDMKESAENQLEIKDFSAESMKCFLDYLYGEDVLPAFTSHAGDMLELADKYQIFGLREDAEKVLRSQIDVQTVCQTLVLADMHGSANLRSDCIQFIIDHRSEIVGTAGFDKLKSERWNLAKEIMDKSWGV